MSITKLPGTANRSGGGTGTNSNLPYQGGIGNGGSGIVILKLN